MRYTATIREASGSTRQQVVDAPTRPAALQMLRSGGRVVLSLVSSDDPASFEASAPSRWMSPVPLPVTRLDIEWGLQQLASMLRSGLPLLAALRTAAEQARRMKAMRLWNHLADRIEAGLSLSDAMAETDRFDSYTLALLRVGEQSGELDRTMSRAADHLEHLRAMRAMLVNALIYPVLVILLTFGVTGFMVIKVIPQVQHFLQVGNRALPEITRLLLDLSDGLRAASPYLLIGTAAALAAYFLIRLSPTGRQHVDAVGLKLPVIGRILRLSATAVVARGLSILLESGVTLLDALEAATRLVRNQRLARRLRDAREAVIRGGTLSQALASAPEFLPMFFRMTAVGEATGTLSATLAEVARFHENALTAAIRRFGILMEPVLILIVGGIVGFVYVAFFLALFSLASTG
ncbi:MAG: type II secretion system F family protein [Verrucomicrobiota bacterium]|jgi:type IV pilus assembly protein PilC|nr:type II secretion system F family protein [Verrucomicrobiota bacterium]